VQQLPDPPKIRRLPPEGAPIPQAGKPRHPMPLEITPDRLVAVMAQPLPGDLQGLWWSELGKIHYILQSANPKSHLNSNDYIGIFYVIKNYAHLSN
jgi:hypothetical protein